MPIVSRPCASGLLVVALGLLPVVAAAQVSFDILPIDPPSQFVPAHPSRAAALSVSADGRVVVGTQELASRPQMAPRTGVRWEAGVGVTALAELPNESPVGFFGDHFPLGLTPDGSTIVGEGNAGTFDERALIWNADGSITSLAPALPTGDSRALDISAAASIVLGQHSNPFAAPGESTGAFLWDAVNGARFLQDLAGETRGIEGVALSDDGAKVAGTIELLSNPFGTEAFRWTEAGGVEGIGFLDGHDRSAAFGISADGSTVVGQSIAGANFLVEAFRWTETGGIEGLGQLDFVRVGVAGGPSTTATSTRTRALATSANGEVVVGSGGTFGDTEAAWIHSEALGETVSLRELLIRLGVVGLEELQLTQAVDVSADGRTIVGWGVDQSADGGGPGFNDFAWRAVIPEPGSALLLWLGLIGLARRRRVD